MQKSEKTIMFFIKIDQKVALLMRILVVLFTKQFKKNIPASDPNGRFVTSFGLHLLGLLRLCIY